jgi:predicted transcriptional regulator of viral defense system
MHDLLTLQAEAYQQGGYFTAEQARGHGVSRQLLDHHVRAGRFQRVRRGLYRVSGFPTGEHDDIREQWLALGPGKAVVSHQSALVLHDLSDNIPNAVHVLVPRRHRGLRRPAGVVVHTTNEDGPIPTVSRDGIAVTTPARSIVDAADQLQPEQLEMAVRQALGRGLLTRRQLEEEAARRMPHTRIDRALTAVER